MPKTGFSFSYQSTFPAFPHYPFSTNFPNSLACSFCFSGNGLIAFQGLNRFQSGEKHAVNHRLGYPLNADSKAVSSVSSGISGNDWNRRPLGSEGSAHGVPGTPGRDTAKSIFLLRTNFVRLNEFYRVKLTSFRLINFVKSNSLRLGKLISLGKTNFVSLNEFRKFELTSFRPTNFVWANELPWLCAESNSFKFGCVEGQGIINESFDSTSDLTVTVNVCTAYGRLVFSAVINEASKLAPLPKLCAESKYHSQSRPTRLFTATTVKLIRRESGRVSLRGTLRDLAFPGKQGGLT